MPANTLLLAIAAGLISAVVFASATTGPMLARFVLFFLTPLSLYLAGLGLGASAAAIAVVVATTTILALTSPLTAFVYALSTGVPAVVTTRLALMSRTDGETSAWYPIGRIVAAAAIFAGVLAALVMLLLGGDTETLTKALHGIVETFAKNEMPKMAGAPEITPQLIDEMTNTTLKTLPWALGVVASVTILLNLWLAGRITLASGRLVRPWPDLSAISMPPAASLALLAATAATFAGGMPGLVASGFAGAFTLGFAVVGLAVAHVFSRGNPWRNFILSALYAALIVFLGPVSLILAIVGLAETVFHYRAAHLNSGPPSPSA